MLSELLLVSGRRLLHSTADADEAAPHAPPEAGAHHEGYQVTEGNAKVGVTQCGQRGEMQGITVV